MQGKMSNEDKLRDVFVEALVLPPGTAVETLSYRGIEEWDSVAHMLLVGELENAFDIMLETQDVIDMSSYDRAREIISKYGVAF